MKCYCYDTDSEFILSIEDADSLLTEVIQHAWFEKTENGFEKRYPNIDGNGVTSKDKELISMNFPRLGQSMFEGMLKCNWEEALLVFASKCKDNDIEWNIFGSVSDVVIGVDIKPHDIDILVHTKDFFKLKNVFSDYVVEPFVDNKGVWLVRYFGRLCLEGVLFDIAAEEKLNRENHKYDQLDWNGFNIFVEPFRVRYNLELERNRRDRLMAMETFMKEKSISFDS